VMALVSARTGATATSAAVPAIQRLCHSRFLLTVGSDVPIFLQGDPGPTANSSSARSRLENFSQFKSSPPPRPINDLVREEAKEFGVSTRGHHTLIASYIQLVLKIFLEGDRPRPSRAIGRNPC
jgi:hypothetical protein